MWHKNQFYQQLWQPMDRSRCEQRLNVKALQNIHLLREIHTQQGMSAVSLKSLPERSEENTESQSAELPSREAAHQTGSHTSLPPQKILITVTAMSRIQQLLLWKAETKTVKGRACYSRSFKPLPFSSAAPACNFNHPRILSSSTSVTCRFQRFLVLERMFHKCANVLQSECVKYQNITARSKSNLKLDVWEELYCTIRYYKLV